MNKVVIYIHGKGGSAEEAGHYKGLFKDSKVIGFDYWAQTPWQAKEEFPAFFDFICQKDESVTIIANSIGAFLAMTSLSDQEIEKAFFISPIVDMEKLITDMMVWAGVSEEDLRAKKEIETDFGERLSWDYYAYVKDHPIRWTIPTHILYGDRDNITSYQTMSKFSDQIKASLTVMKNGDHWFRTKEQMDFLDKWIRQGIW